MLKRLLGASTTLALLFLNSGSVTQAAPNTTATPRVAAMYTTWDDYYFYAGFEITDPNVMSTNTTPSSRPQEDDDVEVFFDTSGKPSATRTENTFQMAVSAGGGAYFSVGDGSKIPVPKVVYTYKYAAKVEGSVNDPTDQDVGYTIELAIPWQELGQTGPPTDGTTWGFNAISRDRSSRGALSDRLYSLSPKVKTFADVQNPSKWTHIVFGGNKLTSADLVVSPHVNTRFPSINGSIISGEWPSISRLAYGVTAIDAPAPTVAEEPNTGGSPFTNIPDNTHTAPTQTVTPPAVVTAPPVATATPNSIELPNGGSIKIVPGGIKDPLEPTPAPTVTDQRPGGFVNPLTVKYPKSYVPPTSSDVSLTGSLALGSFRPTPLILALYRIDYNGDGHKGPLQNVWASHGASALIDQPMNGSGPWFSGLRPLWHRQQLADLRRAGIDVALVEVGSDNTLLIRELDALTAALKSMKAQGQDYPLIGLSLAGNSSPDLNLITTHIPAEFRATYARTSEDQPGLLLYREHPSENVSTLQPLDDGTPLSVILPTDKVSYVSPGGKSGTSFVSRKQGDTYRESWSEALTLKPDFVLIDSWNDFARGTEIAASRQYGEEYADQTRLQAIAFNGSKQWHAKYLIEHVPRVIRPKALYQVALRIENAGTLPWRAGEGYSLCARWYRNGRLYDDSSPRIPLGVDLLPGESATVSVGIAAQNSFGEDLEPGDYVLVFDMVQDQDKWFSYASDVPLQVPVTVLAQDAVETIKPQALFLGTSTPASGIAGASYQTAVSIRNDSGAPWTPDQTLLAYKIQAIDSSTGARTLVMASQGKAIATATISPGEVAVPTTSVQLADAQGKPLAPGSYCLHWFVQSPTGTAVVGSYDESIQVVTSQPAAAFVLSDIPRNVDAGQTATAQIAVQNQSNALWPRKDVQIGYHWYALDGTEQNWNTGQLASLSKDVPAGSIDGAIAAKFRAPSQPGRYSIVWDAKLANGTWASTSDQLTDNDLLQAIVTVGGHGTGVPIDLTKYLSNDTDFDGAGHGLPDEMLPPDRSAELDVNPLLQAKPGLPLYPSGYYSDASGHSVSFLYPASRSSKGNFITCQGQTISLPSGDYKTLHLLAAASGGKSITAPFNLGIDSVPISISDWTELPTGTNVTVGWQSPYRTTSDGDELVPCYLGDYQIAVASGQKLASLTLPNNPNIKIVAISLEK